MQRSQSSGRMSSTLAVGPAMPALLTSTSRPPQDLLHILEQALDVVELRHVGDGLRHRGKLLLGSAARAFSSTSQICTRAPCSTKVRAITRPMPGRARGHQDAQAFGGELHARCIIHAGSTGKAVWHNKNAGASVSIEQEELRGISRTVAEIHWLLLILVLLYLVFGGERDDAEADGRGLGGPVLLRRAGDELPLCELLQARDALEDRDRDLRHDRLRHLGAVVHRAAWRARCVNLYLLPVITSALTLGKLATLANVGLIAACYIFLGSASLDGDASRCASSPGFAAQLAPVLLVAYITTMFSADIRYGLQQREAAVGDRRAHRAVQHARLRHRRQPPVRRRRCATAARPAC